MVIRVEKLSTILEFSNGLAILQMVNFTQGEAMKIADILLLICTLFLTASGQQRSDTQAKDTTDKIILIDPGISLGRATLLLPPSLQDNATPGIPPFLPTGRTPGAPPPFLGGMIDQKADLTAPLRLQMAREAKLRPLWTVLGTVQVGGAAYAAYRYIKKHGLK